MAQILRDKDNKTDLFNFLAGKIVERCQRNVVIITRDDGAMSNQLISLERLAPSRFTTFPACKAGCRKRDYFSDD